MLLVCICSNRLIVVAGHGIRRLDHLFRLGELHLSFDGYWPEL